MSGRTKGPWDIYHGSGYVAVQDFDNNEVCRFIIDGDIERIAADDVAGFIVTACNAHEEMVALLRMLLDAPSRRDVRVAQEAARALLARIEVD